MKLSNTAKLVAAFAVALLLIIIMGAFSWSSTGKLVKDAQLVNHTHEVLKNLESISSRLKDAETGQRGYLITGEAHYLEPYIAGLEEVEIAVANVAKLISDNAPQQKRLDTIKPLIQRKLEELSQTIDLRKTAGFERARDVVLTDAGERTTDNLRVALAEMEQEEHLLLGQRAEATASTATRTKSVVVFGTTISSSILVIATLFLFRTISKLRREVAQRESAERALRDSEQRYRRLMENAGDALFLLDKEGRIIDVNQTACESLGYARNHLLSLSVSDIEQMHSLDQIREMWVQQTPQAPWRSKVTVQGIHQRKDGTTFPVEVRIGRQDFADGPLFLALARDVTDRRQSEQALHHSETRLQSMINSAAAAILTFDVEGTIESCNPAGLALFGYSTEELVGESVKILMPELDQGKHNDYIDNFRTTGDASIIGSGREAYAQRKDGSVFPVDLAVSETRLDNRTMFTGIINDISGRKEAEEALKSLAANLERSNQELQEFASMASHDLQEPLRKVRAFGDLLKSGYGDQIPEEGQDYLRRMLTATERMQTLIDDLLALSHVIAQGEPFVPVNLNIIVQGVCEDLEITLVDEGGSITISPLPTINADPTQMRRLMQNLISNSLKFHKKGQAPIVNIHSEKISASNGRKGPTSSENRFVRVIVEDNGIGFNEKYSERIFHVFQRLHGRNQYPGTGIGLAICRKIVERHGGSITASGRPGEGSSFVITLPVDQLTGDVPKWTEMGIAYQSRS